MSKNIEGILQLAEAIAGLEGRKVLEALIQLNREASDDEIAQKAGLRVNDARKALYELVKHGLISYKRIRHGESTWYSYRWYLDVKALSRTLLRRKRLVLEKLKERLEFEQNNVFYMCPLDGSRYSFDEAFENYFRCPKCGSDLVEVSNNLFIEALKELVNTLSREIEEDEKNIG